MFGRLFRNWSFGQPQIKKEVSWLCSFISSCLLHMSPSLLPSWCFFPHLPNTHKLPLNIHAISHYPTQEAAGAAAAGAAAAGAAAGAAAAAAAAAARLGCTCLAGQKLKCPSE